MKTPRLNSSQIIKILKNHGFIQVSQTGSHLKLFNSISKRSTIVPIHKGKDLPIGTIKAIEKQSGVKFT